MLQQNNKILIVFIHWHSLEYKFRPIWRRIKWCSSKIVARAYRFMSVLSDSSRELHTSIVSKIGNFLFKALDSFQKER